MVNLEKWLDSELAKALPEQIIAICFNLYEDGDAHWSMEMVGTDSFDPDDSDWACDEVYDTRDNPLRWEQKVTWEQILQETTEQLTTYLAASRYANRLMQYLGVGIGFVDGDISIVCQR